MTVLLAEHDTAAAAGRSVIRDAIASKQHACHLTAPAARRRIRGMAHMDLIVVSP
jgi:hypothetical protein